MPKTEVYSWRISPETKQELERAARKAHMSVAALLESIVSRWVQGEKSEDGDEEQRRLHAAAARTIGVLDGGNPRRSEQARHLVRTRLARRYARSRPD